MFNLNITTYQPLEAQLVVCYVREALPLPTARKLGRIIMPAKRMQSTKPGQLSLLKRMALKRSEQTLSVQLLANEDDRRGALGRVFQCFLENLQAQLNRQS